MVSCPTELGRGVIPSMVGLQLTQLSGNCAVHQHVVHNNSISCQKKTTFVGTHDLTFSKNKLLTVSLLSLTCDKTTFVRPCLNPLPSQVLLPLMFCSAHVLITLVPRPNHEFYAFFIKNIRIWGKVLSCL